MNSNKIVKFINKKYLQKNMKDYGLINETELSDKELLESAYEELMQQKNNPQRRNTGTIKIGCEDELQAYLDYQIFEKDKQEILYIKDTQSYYEGEGNFSKLLTRLEDLARKEKIRRLELSVDETNSRAKQIYLHKGFELLNQEPDETGFYYMRKDLDC